MLRAQQDIRVILDIQVQLVILVPLVILVILVTLELNILGRAHGLLLLYIRLMILLSLAGVVMFVLRNIPQELLQLI